MSINWFVLVLILPSNLSYEASLTKVSMSSPVIFDRPNNFVNCVLQVLPVFELAEQKIRKDEILPTYVHLNWTTYDDNCESSLATISAVNGFTSDCAHVQFGPICDYSLGKCQAFFWSDLPSFQHRIKFIVLFTCSYRNYEGSLLFTQNN